MSPRFFQTVCELLGPRCPGGHAEVARIGRPFGPESLNRWVEAGLLGTPAAERLKVLVDMDAVAFEAIAAVLDVGPDFSTEGEWSWEETRSRHGQAAADSDEWSEVESADDDTLHEAGLSAPPGGPRVGWGRFEIGDALFASGRFTDIRRARDLLLGRDVAVHLRSSRCPLDIEAYIAMVRAQAALQHPNVQPVYELAIAPHPEGGDVPFFVTSRPLAETLDSVIKARARGEGDIRDRWPLQTLLEAVLDTARGIGFAHRLGFVHRDLRPKHVYLGHFGEVLVGGWFRVRRFTEPADTQTDARLEVVSSGLGYLAPERLLRGLSASDPAADVWALGALLYAILAERPPFTGPSSSEMLDHIRAGRLIPPGALRSGVPLALEDLCMRALVIDPDDRRLSADEFAVELEGYLEGNRTEARRVERARALFIEADAASLRFMEARTAIHAQRVPGAPFPGAEERDATRIRAARWFQLADEGYIRTESVRPGDVSVRHGQACLYARALQDTRRGWMDLPQAYLLASLELLEADSILGTPGHIEVRTRRSGALVRFHHFVDDEGVLSLDGGRPLGETPVAMADVAAGSYLLHITPKEGPPVRVPVFVDQGEVIRLDLELPAEFPRGTVYIAPGPCRVGSADDVDRASGALPEGRAELPGFFMCREPVTVEQYRQFLEALPPEEAVRHAPRAWPGAPTFWRAEGESYPLPVIGPDGEEWHGDCPITGLLPASARAYAAWRAEQDQVAWRLPTELEWEKAARGADGRTWPWGERPESGFCHHHTGLIDEPVPMVGTALRDESVYGVRDVVGTVRELCEGIDGQVVLRGGSWQLPFESCTATRRAPLEAGASLMDVGFRLAATQEVAVPRLESVEAVRDWPLADPPRTSLSSKGEVGLLSVEMSVGGRTLFRGLPETPIADRALTADPLENGSARYKLLDEIARGSMGRVVLAHDRVLHRHVALKILHDKHKGDALARYRFSMEARITGRLQHPLMLPIYDMGVLPDGRRFFAMRPVEGMSLRDVLARASKSDPQITSDFPRDRLLNIMRRTSQGVAFAHANEIVHRDLKPANILIGQFGEVALVDLGLARQLQPDPSDLADVPEARQLARSDGRVTRVGSVIGTPYYMSPEQAMGLQDMVGPRSDVYGLGAILYHILALRPPFGGTKIHEVLAKVRRGNPRPPSTYGEDVPQVLDRLVLDTLSMDQLERPASAMALADALRAFQEATRLAEEHREWAAEQAIVALQACDGWHSAARRHDRLLAQLARLREDMRQADPLTRHKVLWRADRQIRAELELIDTHAARALRAGRMALAAGDNRAVERLVELLADRCSRARATDEHGAFWFFRRLLAGLDARRAAGLDAGAPLQVTAGPGAVRAMVFHEGSADPLHAGPAPVRLPHVPTGSGHVRLTQNNCVIVAPFVVRRSAPVRLDVRMHPPPEGYVRIPAGPFIYGERLRAGPLWVAEVPGYAIAIHPVTCGEYKAFLDALAQQDSLLAKARRPRLWAAGPGLWSAAGRAAFGDFVPGRPVTGITLADAQAYARWRAQQDGLQLRLPTSAEWEKAARGVDGRRWPWGDAPDPTRIEPGSDPLPLITSNPDDVSIHGMRGVATGVFEWTVTWAPAGGCFVRGDASAMPMGGSPCARRLVRDPGHPSPLVGFRLVNGPPPRSRGAR